MNYNMNVDGDFECQLGGNIAYIYELHASRGQRSGQ